MAIRGYFDGHPRCIDYAHEKVFGIDFDEKSVRVARCLNLIAGDGETNVLHLNALDWRNFDVLMANPPFAGDIKQSDMLAPFELAYKLNKDGTNKLGTAPTVTD